MKTSKKVSKVTKLLYEMFTENTGSHFLDSGGAYGRNHERNGKLSIDQCLALPEVSHETYGTPKDSKDVVIWVNVFRYLDKAGFELDEICERFNKIQNKEKDADFEHMYGTSLKAGEYIQGLGAEFKDAWNTYNDSVQMLSQVLQGCYVEIGSNKYVLLQIHGGCDVRGGYTDAKMFKLPQFAEYLPIIEIYGSIDGVNVDTMYNGSSLTDENGNPVTIISESNIELELMEFSY